MEESQHLRRRVNAFLSVREKARIGKLLWKTDGGIPYCAVVVLRLRYTADRSSTAVW